MEQTKLVCIGCPKGCAVTVSHEGRQIVKIEGYQCKNGLEYAKNEFTNPVRILTSTVRLEGGELARLPVKTKTPIPKSKLAECAKTICSLTATAPVRLGDVICEDICGTGAALIATRDVLTKEV